jgi:hypothetical protein
VRHTGEWDVFLALPRMEGTAAVFSSGFSALSMAACSWMTDRRVLYWEDIDTQGLRILARLRGAFAQTRSVLMDESTFDRFSGFRTDALQDLGGPPTGLSEREAALFSRLAAELVTLRVTNRKIRKVA